MSRNYTVGDSDFQHLLGIPEFRADPLFNQAVAAYGRHHGGKKHCCGGGKAPDSREHLILAAAALRRYASKDPAGLAAVLRREFGVLPGVQVTVAIGGREPLTL